MPMSSGAVSRTMRMVASISSHVFARIAELQKEAGADAVCAADSRGRVDLLDANAFVHRVQNPSASPIRRPSRLPRIRRGAARHRVARHQIAARLHLERNCARQASPPRPQTRRSTAARARRYRRRTRCGPAGTLSSDAAFPPPRDRGERA